LIGQNHKNKNKNRCDSPATLLR